MWEKTCVTVPMTVGQPGRAGGVRESRLLAVRRLRDGDELAPPGPVMYAALSPPAS